MIVVDLPAKVKCDEGTGCKETLSVELVLALTGGFSVKLPDGHGWQILGNPQENLFRARCPTHRTVIERASPAMLKGLQ